MFTEMCQLLTWQFSIDLLRNNAHMIYVTFNNMKMMLAKCVGKNRYAVLVDIIKPQYELSNNVVCATSKASDQPAHTRSLIRAFASRLDIT